MKVLLLSTLIASFSWGYDVESTISLEGEPYQCQTLTIHNEESSTGWNVPRPSFVEMGQHQVFAAEQPGKVPDTFAIMPANGWSATASLVTLEEGETAVIEICPMTGA